MNRMQAAPDLDTLRPADTTALDRYIRMWKPRFWMLCAVAILLWVVGQVLSALNVAEALRFGFSIAAAASAVLAMLLAVVARFAIFRYNPRADWPTAPTASGRPEKA